MHVSMRLEDVRYEQHCKTSRPILLNEGTSLGLLEILGTSVGVAEGANETEGLSLGLAEGWLDSVGLEVGTCVGLWMTWVTKMSLSKGETAAISTTHLELTFESAFALEVR